MYGYYPMFGYGYGMDPTIILVLIGAVLSLWASARMQGAFQKYSGVRSLSGMTGADAANQLLRSQGIFDVRVQPVNGRLTDHYDPRTRTVKLSEEVYHQTSIAAIGVAAHECGHAMQDNDGYLPLKLRAAFVPVASLGSNLGIPLIFIGLLVGASPFITAGIWMFSLAVLFQIVTLPVEFNASRRAVHLLDSVGILRGQEVAQTKKVLDAAALTYVAAAAGSVLQLLRLVLIFGGRRNDD